MDEIRDYVSNMDNLKDFTIELINDGYNNRTYILNKDSTKYVGHVGKQNIMDGSSLLNSFRLYKYLEENGYDFAPRVISFAADLNILIETYVGERDIGALDIEENILNVLIKQLVIIHSIDCKDFKTFCKSNNYSVPQTITPVDSIKRFGVERFERVKTLCPNNEVINWIYPRLENNITIAEAISTSGSPNIAWGDLGGDMRTDGKKVWFIDAEYSSIGYDKELAYLKIHGHPTPNKFEFIVKKYSEYSGINENELHERIKIEELITRVNDVIWAAMKWGENKNDDRVSRKYKKLTFNRMKLCEGVS